MRSDASMPGEEQALDDASRCRIEIRNIVEAAIAYSETETLAAGSNMAAINGEARGHVKGLELLARHFVTDGLSTEPTLAQAIDAQSRAFAEFLETIRLALQDQHARASRSLELAKRIIAFGNQISEVSIATRILSVNAKIESARLGEAGKTVAVIASEVRGLSKTVEAANDVISELARDLSELIPEFATSATNMLEATETFSKRQTSEFHRAYEDTKEQTNELIEDSRAGAARILQSSLEVVSRLQFQDRIAKDLRLVEMLVDALYSTVAPNAPAADTTRLARAEPRTTPLADESSAAGDVLLF